MVVEDRLGSCTSKPMFAEWAIVWGTEGAGTSECVCLCLLAFWGCYCCPLTAKQRVPLGKFPNLLPCVIWILPTVGILSYVG